MKSFDAQAKQARRAENARRLPRTARPGHCGGLVKGRELILPSPTLKNLSAKGKRAIVTLTLAGDTPELSAFSAEIGIPVRSLLSLGRGYFLQGYMPERTRLYAEKVIIGWLLR